MNMFITGLQDIQADPNEDLHDNIGDNWQPQSSSSLYHGSPEPEMENIISGGSDNNSDFNLESQSDYVEVIREVHPLINGVFGKTKITWQSQY